MFSRRHPILFFILSAMGIFFAGIIVLSLVLKINMDVDSYGSDKVGVIEVNGMIGSSKGLLEEIRKFKKDSDIKAIVLRINSSGGFVAPSQEIYNEILKVKKEKKIIASLETIATSGAYYIASAANGIIASKGTITGGIGVILKHMNVEELWKKIGLESTVIKSGKYKDMGSPFRDMTEMEESILQSFSKKIHMQFISDVSAARSIDIESMKAIADGRIFTGEEAQNVGLIDRIGNFEDAVEWAGRAGGIKGDIGIVYFKRDTSFMDMMKKSSINSIQQGIESFLYATKTLPALLYEADTN